MAINPVDRSTTSPAQTGRQQATTRLTASSSFANVLQQLNSHPEQLTPEKARSVAELMRLEQMRAIIDPFPGSESSHQTSARSASALFLSILNSAPLAQTSDTQEATASPEQAEVAPPASTGTVAVSPPLNTTTQMSADATQSLQQIISNAAKRYGVDESLIKAVIKAESNFNPQAVSHAGAQGLMQLMPSTARGLGVTNPFDPQQNVMAGTSFLKEMLKRYDGNVDAALAAYNWGPGNVDRKGMNLPRETREYLVKVKTYYQQLA